MVLKDAEDTVPEVDDVLLLHQIPRREDLQLLFEQEVELVCHSGDTRVQGGGIVVYVLF